MSIYITFNQDLDKHLNIQDAHKCHQQAILFSSTTLPVWNSLPAIDFDQSISVVKTKLKTYLCKHFLNYFNEV